MNLGHHERAVNAWRYKWQSFFLSVKLLAALVVLSTSALAQFNGQTPADGTICPLSESQTKKSIEAFSKIASAISKENRCLGCHGRVNPYIDGTGADPENPDAVPSQLEHGGENGPGKVDRKADCNDCHSKMARRTRDGSESKWMTAPDFLSFIGKDAPTLCKQIRDNLPTGKDFLGHIKDDNGGNNFAGTAFNGDRGLDREMFPEKEVPTERPHITHAALMKLGQDWVASTGGEFKGDKACGCEPAYYAVRYSTSTHIAMEGIEHTSEMEPVDIPITFNDDGTFTGDGKGTYQAAGVAEGCSEQSGLGMNFHVSGQAIETSQKRSMTIKLGNPSPMAYKASAECPDAEGASLQVTLPSSNVTTTYNMKGEAGEAIDKEVPGAIPGIVSKVHVEIVKTAEPAP